MAFTDQLSNYHIVKISVLWWQSKSIPRIKNILFPILQVWPCLKVDLNDNKNQQDSGNKQ
jgi:hypothetical protein